MNNIKIFAGNSNLKLALKISKKIRVPLSKCYVGNFSDGEINIKIHENVRGDDIFIIQSICYPNNNNLMELLIMVDAFRRASVGRITAVIPYFGYARQDRRVHSSRVPITAKIIANLLTNVGVNRILTVDLHSDQIQGFFDIPVDNIFGSLVFINKIIQKKYTNQITVVSPDAGGILRARSLAKILDNAEIAIIDKRRHKFNNAKIINVIGNINNRDCILIDDIIDTGNTLFKAAKTLKERGAQKIYAYITHPILSGNYSKNFKQSVIDEISVCDSINLSKKININMGINIETLSDILSESIRRINNGNSISAIFKNDLK
ncbi:MAG: ribose-phosphate pyrophosphokinase [Enterobacteriaceae bacterium PC38]|nr:MAG: ribose-phosphate pyrophosphokinase [Enterobacteriaceae bacterium PC38]